jgi:hypothetical protein
MPQSENINELAAALAKAQGTMKAAHFNKTNPHFKNKYADLTAILEAVRHPLSENGLAIVQTPEIMDGAFCLVTRLLHSSGQYIAGEYPLPAQATPQQIGSAITYAKRYSLCAIVGISADDDDDAEATRKEGVMVTTVTKRENPHTPMDKEDYPPRYAANGEQYDWINTDRASEGIKPAMASKGDNAAGQAWIREMHGIATVNDLVGWAEDQEVIDRLAAFPPKWQDAYQRKYREYLDFLRKQQKAA